MAGLFLLISPAIVSLRDPQPFDVPALGVAGLHAARRLEHLAHRAAALLRLAERAAELVGHEEVLGPVMPPKRLISHWGWNLMSFTSLPYLAKSLFRRSA